MAMTNFLTLLIKLLDKLDPLKLLTFTSILLTFYILISKIIMGNSLDPFFSDSFLLFLILVGLVFLALGAIKYLDSARDENKDTEEISNAIIENIVSSHMKKMIEDFQTDTAVSISENDKENLLKDLKIQIEAKLSEEHYKDIKRKIKNEWLESEIDFSIRTTTARLKEEINTLKLRSNLNLVIGMILCFSGIIALYVFLQKNVEMYVLAYKDHNINEIILTLLPNAFFVLLIEIFSYFFLNLYKKSIEEIKFYQNELTNLESKFLALKTAKITNNHKLQCIILEEIVKTERNFILEQGQSTIEIEKEKISSTNSSNVIKAATELLNFNKLIK